MGNKSDSKTLIKAEDLSLSYDGKPVISSLSFDIRRGDYVCIIGENGSGKSSLIGAILGLNKPSGGKISYLDVKNDQIGFLPQFSHIEADFPATVNEVVLSGCLTKSRRSPFLPKNSKQIAFSAMEKLGITALSKRSFKELSGGQKQRVLFARALCAAEKLFVLDEPTTGLDRAATADVYALMEDLNKSGMTIICVTHDVCAALKYSTKILRINKDSYLFIDTDEYKKLPEAQAFLFVGNEENDAPKPYGEGGFRYNGGEKL